MYVKIAKKSFENRANLKQHRMVLTNQNYLHEGIKNTLC